MVFSEKKLNLFRRAKIGLAMEERNGSYRDEIFSKSVRAGKRTYFFDVKTTRGNDLYLTITESKKRVGKEGKFYYEKHKLFLYKEDFEKFAGGLEEAVAKIESLRESGEFATETTYEKAESSDDSQEDSVDISSSNGVSDNPSSEASNEFTNIDFEDI